MSGLPEVRLPYFTPAPGRPDFSRLPMAEHPVSVSDMRSRPSGFSLDREGFTLVEAPTAVRDFYDAGELTGRYCDEARALVRSLTGCSATAVMNAPLVRVASAAGDRPAGTAPTGDGAHADLAAVSAGYLLRRSVPAGEADELLRRRHALFNVWRTFSGPPQDMPLALCDSRSVAPEDRQVCSITLETSAGSTMSWDNVAYLPSPRHEWWYCRDMRREEAFVFRSFDSAREAQVPHTAFRDPSCPPGTPPRASVEVRVFAFFDR